MVTALSSSWASISCSLDFHRETCFGSSAQPSEPQLHVSTPSQPQMNLATAVSQDTLVVL